MRFYLLAFTSIVLMASTVMPKARASAASSADDFPPAPKVKIESVYDAKASSALLAAWLKGERMPAQSSAQLNESNMSESMKAIRKAMMSVRSADDLDAKLTELEAGYPKMSEDAQFLATQLLLLKPMRGIVWKLRPLFEAPGQGLIGTFTGNKATHSAAVTMMRVVSQATSFHLPSDQSKTSEAIFDYLVTPSKKMRLSDRFETVLSFQRYLREVVYKKMADATEAIDPMIASGKKPYVFDYQMFYGEGSFRDGIGRYGAFGDAEVLSVQASLHKGMHDILVFDAYNMNDLINVIGDLGRLYGVNGFWSSELGVSSAQRKAVYKPYMTKTDGFLTLRKPRANPNLGREYMQDALLHLQRSAALTKDAYVILSKAPADSVTMFNPLFFKSDLQPALENGVNSLAEAVQKRTTVRNTVTGKTTVVDIPGFYNNPPPKLLELLPTSFVSSDPTEIPVKNEFGETLMYRNYRAGQPKTWNTNEWQRIFPNLENGSNVSATFRNVIYGHGPVVVLGSLAYFID